MIHTSKQLKDLVRNMARSTGVESHVPLRKYMMERLLERVSLSPYKNSFVLKGGLLVSAIVGVDIRATMDMDTTVKGVPLTPEDMERIIGEIASVPLEDGVSFQIKSVSPIMDEDEYGGLRVSMDDWMRPPQSGDCYRGLDHCYMTQDLSKQSDHIKIDGYSGTWRVIKTAWMHPPRERSCMPCFLLEQALSEDKKVYLIVNRFGIVLNDAVARGFESMIAAG